GVHSCEPAAAPRVLHSFPTRRSSDLNQARQAIAELQAELPHLPAELAAALEPSLARLGEFSGTELLAAGKLAGDPHALLLQAERSEEHTSELQSRENLVCRLLLEKKK